MWLISGFNLITRKKNSTHITLEGLLPCMSPHVFIKAPFLTEGLVTLGTLVRLFLQRDGINREHKPITKHNSFLEKAGSKRLRLV